MLSLREAVKGLIIIREPEPRKRVVRPPEVIRAEKFQRMRKLQRRAKLINRRLRRRELELERAPKLEADTIRGLLALQRIGRLWVWCDAGEIRVSKTPDYFRSKGITLRQARNLAAKATFLCIGKS